MFGYRNSTVTLTNSGTIAGDDGAFFGAGGDVTNQTGGNITGVLVGLNIKGPANIANAGIILGATQTGIDLAGQGNVTNSGLVSGGKYGLLLASGDVTNQAGGVITGPSAGVEFSGAGVLSNAGLISAGNGPISFGVLVESDADVTNLAGGTITGTYALAIRGAGTVTNAGLIGGAATAGEALYIGKNALVTNQAGGSIASAGAYGIIINGAGTVINAAGATISSATASTGAYRGAALYISGPGNVTNAGAITAGGDATVGVYLEAGGLRDQRREDPGGQYGVYTAGNTTITNAAGGTISFTGNATAINKYSAVQVNGVGTVTNAGNISGAATIFAYGVRMSSGTLTNSGNIVVNGLASLAVDITGAGSVTNSGTIKGTLGVGIVTGNVTNLKTGAIAGSIEGIVMLTGTVTNAGYIGNRNGYAGIGIVKDGVIVNQAGGTISGGGFGIVGVIGNTTVTNAAGATISASGNSTTFASGFGLGVYIRSIGSITNAGTISAVGNTSGGIELRGGGTVVNTGVISGGLYGVTTAGIGLYGSTGGTVTNAGTISGGAASVVFLGNTTNVLTLETGSTLIGSAIGSAGAGATNALVLQGHGVANNVFVNFNTLTVNASGVWALNGGSTIGATSINSGDLEVGDAGHPGAVLTSPVTINAGGTLSGHGTVAGSVVDNGGTVSPGGTIGTLTISGNLTLNAGSTTDIEIAPPSQSSLLMVAGTAALGGGVDFLADPGVYRKGEQFHFLTAGAISGAFTSVVVSNGLPGSLVQGATTDTLTLLAGNFAPVGGTSNQNAVGAAVNDVPVGAGDFDAVANPLIALGPGAAQNHALDELGGEIYADTLSVGRQATRGFLATLGDRLEGAELRRRCADVRRHHRRPGGVGPGAWPLRQPQRRWQRARVQRQRRRSRLRRLRRIGRRHGRRGAELGRDQPFPAGPAAIGTLRFNPDRGLWRGALRRHGLCERRGQRRLHQWPWRAGHRLYRREPARNGRLRRDHRRPCRQPRRPHADERWVDGRTQRGDRLLQHPPGRCTGVRRGLGRPGRGRAHANGQRKPGRGPVRQRHADRPGSALGRHQDRLGARLQRRDADGGRSLPGDPGGGVQALWSRRRQGRRSVQRRPEPRRFASAQRLRPLRRVDRPGRHRADPRPRAQIPLVNP